MGFLSKLFGATAAPTEVIQAANPPSPPPPPADPAAPPQPNDAKSGELDKALADKTGFGALIIPRTYLAPASKNVTSG